MGFFDQNVHAAIDAGNRQVAMQVSGRSDGYGVDTLRQQPFHVSMAGAAERAGNEIALPQVGIRHANQAYPGKIGKNPRMVAAHDADADHAYAKQAVRAVFRGLHHG